MERTKKAAALLLCLALVMASTTAGAAATRYPVAMVNVHPDSWLNVRDAPMGKWLCLGLTRGTDVVILETVDGWALVQQLYSFREEIQPLGWVCMDYLVIYRDYIITEEDPQQ